MDLSITIVSWNTRDLLDGCLESIFKTTQGVAFEVIVVDNASSDGSAEMVREKFPQVRLIENVDNVGFAAANNQAYAVTESEFFLLLNPDTVVMTDAIQTVLRAITEDERRALVAPKLLWLDGSIQPSVGRFPSLASELCDALYLTRIVRGKHSTCIYVPAGDCLTDIEWACGACLLVRRQAVRAVMNDPRRILDDRFFMFSEETDLCKMLRDGGWTACYEPRATITHVGAASTSKVRRAMLAGLYESKFIYFGKHHGRAYANAYRFIVLPIHLLVRIAGYLPARVFHKSQYTLEQTHPMSQLAVMRRIPLWRQARK